MHCTLAFLLLATSKLQDRSLLALVNNYDQYSYYNVYEIDHVKKFPVPDDGTNVFMTQSVYNGDGTYVASYCSESAHGNEIVKEISHGLKGKFEDFTGSFGNYDNSRSQCLSEGGIAGHQAKSTDKDLVQIILSRTVANYEVSLAWVREELKVFLRMYGQEQLIPLSDITSKERLGGLIHQVAWHNDGPFSAVKELLESHQNAGSHSGGITGVTRLGRLNMNNEQALGKRIKALVLPKLEQTPKIYEYHGDNSYVPDFWDKLFPTRLQSQCPAVYDS